MISGFHHGVNEVCALLGCYAVYIGISLPTFRYNLLASSSGVTYYQSVLYNIAEEQRYNFFVIIYCFLLIVFFLGDELNEIRYNQSSMAQTSNVHFWKLVTIIF